MAWPHFSMSVCHAFPSEYTPVRGQDKISHLFMRALSSSKGPTPPHQGQNALGPFCSLQYILFASHKKSETQDARQQMTSCHFSASLFHLSWSSPREQLSISWKKAETDPSAINFCSAKVLQAHYFPSWAFCSLDTVVGQQPEEQGQALLPVGISSETVPLKWCKEMIVPPEVYSHSTFLF